MTPTQLFKYATETDLPYYAAHLSYYACPSIVGALRSTTACYYLYMHYFNDNNYTQAISQVKSVAASNTHNTIKETSVKMDRIFTYHTPEEIKKFWLLQLIRGVTEFFFSVFAVFIWVLKDHKYESEPNKLIGEQRVQNPFHSDGAIPIYNICGIVEAYKAVSWEQSVTSWEKEYSRYQA